MINVKRLTLIVLGVLVVLVAGIIHTNDPSTGGDGPGTTATTFSSFENAIGNEAPRFKLLDTQGKWVTLSDFKDKVIILNFWATWCAPCREEIPGFVKLQERYADDVVIIGISMDQDGHSMVPRFMERYGMNYPVLYGDSEVSWAYGGITGIPMTFVIDRNLIIQRVYIGYRPESVFERDIQTLI